MTRIENERQYNWAVKRVEQLLPLVDDSTPETDNNFIELKLLSNLVADYSEENFAIGNPKLSDILQLRMYELGLNQKRLAEILQVSQSRISEYLTGKSEPTLKVARTISQRLNISSDIILGV